MVQLLSVEPDKRKAKGTRSVSTLTPAQLARKRAKDREAQRLIRTRTKERIAGLERELVELKSEQCRDRIIEELLRRNKAMVEELVRLRRSTSLLPYSSQHLITEQIPQPDEVSISQHHNGSLLTSCSTTGHPRKSSMSCNSVPYLQEQYSFLSSDYEALPDITSSPTSLNISSPSPLADYNTSSLTTSIPILLSSSNNSICPNSSFACDEDIVEIKFENMSHGDAIPQADCLAVMRQEQGIIHPDCLDMGFNLDYSPLHTSATDPYSYRSH